MSSARKEVTESVPITVCDICGEEIEFDKDDRDATGTLGGFNPEAGHKNHPTSKTPRIRFGWPVGAAKRRAEEAKAQSESTRLGKEVTVADVYVPTNYYDFHGECLAKLVVAAVGLRKNGPSPDEEKPVDPLVDLATAVEALRVGGMTVQIDPAKGSTYRSIASWFNGVHVAPGEVSTMKRSIDITIRGDE